MRGMIFLLLIISTPCFGQEMPSPCDVIMADYPNNSVLVASSDNGKFLVRLEQGRKSSNPKAFVFEWHKKSYLLRRDIALKQGLPIKLMISDSGTLVSLGKRNARSNIDEINIYSKGKGLVKTIESIGQDYPGGQESCKIRKPWICWRYPTHIDDENLNLLDLNGNEVDIDLATGQYKTSKSVDDCGDYN